MKKAYYLSTCSTCKKIIQDLQLADQFFLQDIKTNKITAEQLEEMAKLAGDTKLLFSKRSRKYSSLGKQLEEMSESEVKNNILEEYTFLKRPVIIIDGAIFIGSSKEVKSSLAAKLKIKN